MASLKRKLRRRSMSSWEVKVEDKDYLGSKYEGEPIDVLIDGDISAYRAASATDGKCYCVYAPGLDPKKIGYREFKYKKDADKHAAELSKSYHGVTTETAYSPEPVERCYYNIDAEIESILEEVSKTYGRPVVPYVFITGKKNFRQVIHPDYKRERKATRKPAHLKAAKQHLIDKWDAQLVEGYEADDLLAIEATSRSVGEFVIASLDKDLLQIPGDHYNFVKKKFQVITPEEGRHRFWIQSLMGDKVDGIQGLWKVGPKTSEAILEDLLNKGSDFDYYRRIIETYAERLGAEDDESHEEYLGRVVRTVSQTCRLLWLCRDYDTTWEIPKKTIWGKSPTDVTSKILDEYVSKSYVKLKTSSTLEDATTVAAEKLRAAIDKAIKDKLMKGERE